MQNWGFSDGLQWNVPAWSISTEFFAYLCFPLLVALLKICNWPTWSLCISLGFITLGLHWYFRSLGFNFAGGIEKTGLLRCVAQFFMGMILCVLFLRDHRENVLKIGLLLMAAVIFISMRMIEKQAPVIPLIWVTMILGFALWRRANPLLARPLVWLGDVSYATYLCHYLAFIVFKLVFVGPEQTPLWLILGFYGGVLVASHLLYRYVEKPSQRWLTRQYGVSRMVRAESANG
nr:acyltransferase [Sphingosinicella soli]